MGNEKANPYAGSECKEAVMELIEARSKGRKIRYQKPCIDAMGGHVVITVPGPADDELTVSVVCAEQFALKGSEVLDECKRQIMELMGMVEGPASPPPYSELN